VANTREIRIRHNNLIAENILDWGLEDPFGSRGWSGGSPADIVVAETAASFSYSSSLNSALPTGTWHVVIGKARIDVPPGFYDLTVTLYSEQSLPPQPEREIYAPPAPLSNVSRFYAGDFHVHSHHSDGGSPRMWSLDEIGVHGVSVALDFVIVTDHNTVSHLSFFNDAQSRFDSFLFIPGNEFTTYNGHCNAIGAFEYVDHKIGYSTSINQAMERFRTQGAAVSINHFEIDYGFITDCIGCEWEYQRILPMDQVDAMEVGISSFDVGGWLFSPRAVIYWDKLCAAGHHLTPLGGSDFHYYDSSLVIGNPRVMVFADELSVEGITQGVKNGRTVVKFTGGDAPMVVFDALPLPDGRFNLTVVITGGVGHQYRFVRNGLTQEEDFQPILRDPLDDFILVDAPPIGQDQPDRYRVEVYSSTRPERIGIRTMTSHVYIYPETASKKPRAAWK
jgi:hypothetical protein